MREKVPTSTFSQLLSVNIFLLERFTKIRLRVIRRGNLWHQEEDSEDRKDKIDSVSVPPKDAPIRTRKINLFIFLGRLSPKII
jgi:hypothetical protein